MKNNIFVSSAIITTIFEKEAMDNIDLVKPFVLYIISEKYEVNDEINLELIHNRMDELFSFKEMPIAIIKKIINRIRKEVEIELIDGKYFLRENINDYSTEFDLKKRNASESINKLAEHFRIELTTRGMISEGEDVDAVELYLNEFLEMNGYSFVKNIADITEIPVLSDELHFNICDIIIKDYNEKNEYFELFYKFVEGFMLVNVVYLQIENNNKESLKKLDIYLDTPLILNALGLKTKSKNLSTEQLLKLLKGQKAKLCCFREHYEEVENIINAYKRGIGKINAFRTLERFDEDGVTESEVELYCSSLENKLLSLDIKIVDKPNIKKVDYEYYIDESKLVASIKKVYAAHLNLEKGFMNDQINIDAIETDVAAANSINYFRCGNHRNSLENSKAVFITDNNTLIYQVNKGVGIRGYQDTKIFMSEIDLTTIVWQKSYSKNRDLLKTSLISNVQSGFEPPYKMLEEVSKSIKRLSDSIGDEDYIDISKLLSSSTLKRELMYKTNGNHKNLTDQVVDELITSRAKELSEKDDNEKRVLISKNTDLEREKANVEKELKQIKEKNKRKREKEIESIRMQSNEYAQKKYRPYTVWVNILFILLILLVIGSLVYLVINSNNNKGVETFIQFFTAISIIALLIQTRIKVLGRIDKRRKKTVNKKYHDLMLELDDDITE